MKRGFTPPATGTANDLGQPAPPRPSTLTAEELTERLEILEHLLQVQGELFNRRVTSLGSEILSLHEKLKQMKGWTGISPLESPGPHPSPPPPTPGTSLGDDTAINRRVKDLEGAVDTVRRQIGDMRLIQRKAQENQDAVNVMHGGQLEELKTRALYYDASAKALRGGRKP